MESRKSISLKLFLVTLFLVGLAACGNDANLVLSPAGPTVVKKGANLQFTSNRSGTTYAVEGGSANGTIDNNGLYTPPATLPINPRVTVTGQAGSQTASALVDLRTADTLALGSPDQINDTAIPSTAAISEIIGAGLSDRIAVRLGSIQVDSTWAGANGSGVNVFFSQNLDFGGWDPEANLTNDSANSQLGCALAIDSHENPGMLFVDGSSGDARLKFLGSTDKGNSFTVEDDVFASDPAGTDQLQGALRIDNQDVLHAVFLHGNTSGIPPLGEVVYTQSTDGGVTWSAPIPVGKANAASQETFPQLAVDPSNGNIYACWNDDNGSSGATQNIYFSVLPKGASAFNTPIPIANTTGKPLGCRVATDPTNHNVYVTYSDKEASTSNFGVFIRTSTNTGGSFGSAVEVNSASTNMTDTTFAMMGVDSLGRIDVVWTADPNSTGNNDTLMYSRSLDQGAHFSAAAPITPGAPAHTVVALGLRHDDSGRLHIQFLSDANNPGTSYDIFYLLGQ